MNSDGHVPSSIQVHQKEDVDFHSNRRRDHLQAGRLSKLGTAGQDRFSSELAWRDQDDGTLRGQAAEPIVHCMNHVDGFRLAVWRWTAETCASASFNAYRAPIFRALLAREVCSWAGHRVHPD